MRSPPVGLPPAPGNSSAALPTSPKWLQMRDLLNSGLRLPVEMPEVEDLRLSVKR